MTDESTLDQTVWSRRAIFVVSQRSPALSLVQRIEIARRLLREGRLTNESSVSTSIVSPILRALGWDVDDPDVMAPEYAVGSRRVDFALLHLRKPLVFVEVKQPGQSVGADRQLFEYAFHAGVPLAVLTDGRTWSIYLPAGAGDYTERRVYLLDLEERDPDESAERLRRYLQRDDVVSEAAFQRAQVDYQRSRQRREAREAIPAAWKALIETVDERLVESLASEVESRSGYRPEPEDVFGFLSGLSLPQDSSPKRLPTRQVRVAASSPRVSETSAPAPPDGELPSVGFMLDGRFTPARTGKDALTGLLRTLADRDPGFLDRFVALPKHGRTRRYIAKERSQLNPSRPDLSELSVEIRPGYWLTTNTSSNRKRIISKMACDLMGLRFGKDVKVRFP